MSLRPWLLAFAVLALGAPAQEDESRVYFSLNTEKPIRPGEAAQVRVQAQGVRQLEFRLYRVNDPVRFFRQLDDPHQFSGAPRRTPKARTPLEKFAAWKRSWRSRWRDAVRLQFSAAGRHSIRAALHGEPPKKPQPDSPKKGTGFAGVPVLNPQQLVRSWTQPIQTPRKWEAATVPVAVSDKGLYVLEATDGKKQAYTILSVTDLALITKASPGRLLVRAVERSSGAPVASCPVQVYDSLRRTDLARGETASDGLFEMPVPSAPDEDVVVLAQRGADFAVATVGSYGLSTGSRFNLTGYVYTDRPIYRPGHPVHFRAILRTMAGADYRLPDRSSVRVEIEDPEGKSILKKQIPLSSFGTAAGDLALAADAPLGYYSVSVGLSGEQDERKAYGGFHVEEYRKPDYEVKVTPAQRRLVQGGNVKLAVEARYYYGEPVAGGGVTYVVHRNRYWAPWYEANEAFDEEDGEGYGGEQISEQKARLDAQGRLEIDVPAPRGDFDATYRIEARVTDSSNREISGAGSFVATRGPFFVTAQPARYVYGPGDAARVVVETRDYDGNAVPGIAFRLELALHQRRGSALPAVLVREGRTGGDGKATVEFPAPPSGAYDMRTASPNPMGGEIRDTSWLWVSGAWSGGADVEQRIQIVPDRKSYKPGETAKLLIATGVEKCDLWLSVEGKTLYWSKFLSVKGGTATVELPIESSHAPNVFVDAVFVSNNTLYRGSKSLSVPPVEKQIQVEVQSAKAEYKPGEPATFTVLAKDYSGKPVSAEFSLGVVDEAIYAVKREAQPDILKVFYGRTYNRVQTDTSMDYYFSGEAGTRRMQLAHLRASSSRAQLKPARMVEPRIRKNFPDTAYWIADLKTGADGRAQARMAFPDSLTTWRTTTRGVTADSKVGGAVQRTVVRKNLLVTMATPRFLTEGDEVNVPVIVRNYLPSEQKIQVSLAAKGVEMLSGAAGEITVAPKGEGRVDYRIRANAVDQAVLTATALGGVESDALELTLPVEPYGLKISDAAQKRLDGASQSHGFPFVFPAEASPNWRTVTVHLTPSVAGAVFGALEYLISYPYGCTEQTMSSFLPNVVVTQALKELNLPSTIDQKELNKKARAGLERLYEFQHEDGGWGWWKGDASDAFMTAYVAGGLQQAIAAGYLVEEDHRNRAGDALASLFDAPGRMAPDTRAYALYSLAQLGKASKPRLERVWNERGKLTSFGWALLGLAYLQVRDGRSADVAGELARQAKQRDGETWWESNRDAMLDFETDNSLEATALALKFLARAEPGSALIDGAAQWLVNHRDQGYYWSSTKRTAFVVFGLTDVLKRSGELKPDYRVRVLINGKETLNRKFDAGDALKPEAVKLRVPIDPKIANPQVSVEKQGAGRLYASVRWEYRATGAGSVRARPAENATRLNRNYYRLSALNEGGRIVYAMEPLVGQARPGDLIAVRLSLFGAAGQRYLLVEDLIPTGAEVVPRDDLYEIRGKPSWWRGWYERRELRDARVTFFPWSIPRDGLEYVYLLRFTNAGLFHAAPAHVEPMYSPGTMSWSEPAILEVRP